jgi:type IV secretory pathway VirB2 component (pilin)
MAVGTVAIAALGFAAALGKVSWGMCLITSAGIGAVYGAFALMNNLGIAAFGAPGAIAPCP